MRPAQPHRRQIIVRIPEDWAAWQLEWAMDFLAQVERKIWTIFEEHHLHDAPDDAVYGDEPGPPQLELALDDQGRFSDDEIPF